MVDTVQDFQDTIWYSADSTYPGMVIPFSQRYLISWVNSYHRWAAALSPPRVWTTWDITTANLHMSPSTGADFNLDDKSCNHNAFAIMKITCSHLGWDAMKISNLTFKIIFIPWISTNNEQYTQLLQYKLIPGHLARVQFLVGGRIFPVFYSLGTGSSFQGAKCPNHKGDRSSPTRAEMRNGWSYTTTPSNGFMALSSWIGQFCLIYNYGTSFFNKLIHNKSITSILFSILRRENLRIWIAFCLLKMFLN
jgi:hypothetical protein